VKGVKKIGVRLGNWLLPDQAVALLEAPDLETMKGKRDLALLAILVACGLRRHEAVALNVSDLQQREDHWEIVDLIGKAASHIRTIPRPDWVKNLVDDWLRSAGISNGKILARDPSRHRVGKRVDRESRVARCKAVCEKSRHRQTCSARSPANLRPALSSGRR
jgi:integrase